MSEYRVQLDTYDGPLDLMLYLIRRDEIDIYDIPIARVTEQYIHFIELLKVVDPNSVGDFLVMLATLIEIKSRAMLPKHLAEDEEEDEWEDPRMELVRQLLEYKAFKDAANDLGSAAEIHRLRFPRRPVVPVERGEVDIEDVSVWALMQAFQSLLEQTGKTKPVHEVVYDDTPINLHAIDIVDQLQHAGDNLKFGEIFTGRTKVEMIGLFLALLELIRQHRVRIVLDENNQASITIHLLDTTPIDDIVEEAEPVEPEQEEPDPAEAEPAE